MAKEQQLLDSETGRELASLIAPVRDDTGGSIATSSLVSVISLGDDPAGMQGYVRTKPSSAVLENAVFHRSPAGERPHVPVEGSALPKATAGTARNHEHVVIQVDKRPVDKSFNSEERSLHSGEKSFHSSSYTFGAPENGEDASGKMRMSFKSQTSQLSDTGSVGSIMDWARRTVGSNSRSIKGEKKWGPISDLGIKPEAKCPVGAMMPGSKDSEDSDSLDESTSDAPPALPSTKSIVKFRSNPEVEPETRPSLGDPQKTPPKSEEKSSLVLKSKLKRSMSREVKDIVTSPKGGDSNETGTLSNGTNLASKRWAKLSRQRSGIIKMSTGSNVASQAVREALSEIDDQISRCGDTHTSAYDDDPHSENVIQTITPKLGRSKSFEHRRLARQPSNLSVPSKKSEPSDKVGPQSEQLGELPSLHEMHEVWAEDETPVKAKTHKKRAQLSNSVSFLSATSHPVSNFQKYFWMITWWMLRIVTVLFSLATLLAQVLMQEQDFGDITISICACSSTVVAILFAFLSGRPAVLAAAIAGIMTEEDIDLVVEERGIEDIHQPMTQSSAGGWIEPSQAKLLEVRATLETAYSALATTEKEMTLWDQLREEQQGLLRSFNKIVTQDLSLHRGKTSAFVVIVEESEALRKQLADLCTEMQYKVKDFSSVEDAASTITDFAPSIASSNNDQKGILKNRPGASHKDWRNNDMLNACKSEQDEWARVVFLGASQLPDELPLPETLTDETLFLTLCGTAQELGDSADRLDTKPGHSYRDRWKAEGVKECMIAPFTKEAVGAIVMEAIHVRFREEFLLLENIGQGTWGNVFRAKRLGDGKVMALKMVNAKRLQQKVRDAMDREVQLLRVVRWPSILFLLDAWVSEQMQCMLLPLCDGGDLLKETTAAAKAQSPISSIRLFEWYAQTLHGLAYLHWRGVVHADIKPSNLLLAIDKRSLIIGDFGSAMLLPGNGPHPCRGNFVRRPNCTPVYAPPESMLQEIHYASSDVWSVGASFFEIATFKCLLPAFLGDAKSLLQALDFEDVSSGGNLNRAKAALAALRDSKTVGDLKPELLEMFNRDPLKRPSAAGLALRSKVSEQLQTLLVETGAVKPEEKVDHFKDFAKLLIESEESADTKPAPECKSIVEESSKDSKSQLSLPKPEHHSSGDKTSKPFLRRSATQPM